MKRTNRMAIVAGALTLATFSSALALAQRGPAWRGGGGWGHGGAYGRMYDPKTVETVSGAITAIETFTPMRGMRGGVHLKLDTGKEVLSIHLGPSWFIENQEPQLAAKDKVEVRGSRVLIDGKPAIIAAEVRKGDERLVLRDGDGVPVWAGWRRR